jgi:NDP-sugar pyrophosphorylase family protein
MNIMDYPAIILASGSGKRMGNAFGNIHKGLIPIYGMDTIIDVVIYELIKLGISDINIIAGSNYIEYKEYFKEKRKFLHNKPGIPKISDRFEKTKIQIIEANSNHINGPLFTLLTIKPFLAKIKHRTINKSLEKSNFKLWLFPCDTIFNLDFLKEIFVLKFSKIEENKGNYCHLFYARISDNNLKEKDVIQSMNETEKGIVQIPIAILSDDFLDFIFALKKFDVNKVSAALDIYHNKTGLVKHHYLHVDRTDFPPFIDIDTKKMYDETVNLITSLISEKK